MIEIIPIQPEHIQDAKRVICVVAHGIFGIEKSLDEFIEEVIGDHELDDMDNYRELYIPEKRGLFLVVLDDGRVVGTGALRKKTDEVAELKRIWLLEEYHGRQIGYRVVNQLLDFAREQGYKSVYLESTQRQKRALAFYRRMGFQDVPSPHDAQDFDGVSMEMALS